MQGYIYKITNILNNKLYIGKTTTTIEKRFKRHIKQAINPESKHRFLYLYNAMRKDGIENFKIELLETVRDEDNLDEREKYWIATLHTFIDDPLCNGYNMTNGGDGGHWSKVSSEKARQTKIKNGTNKHSEKTKYKISVANKGKPKSELHKQHLSEHHHLKTTHILYYKDGHTELSTNSIKTLATRLNVTAVALRRASEIGLFRCGEFFLLDLTDLDHAFKHKYQLSKDKILIDPITNELISPTSLHAKYQHNPDLYNFQMPEFKYISNIEQERQNYIKLFTEIRKSALK